MVTWSIGSPSAPTAGGTIFGRVLEVRDAHSKGIFGRGSRMVTVGAKLIVPPSTSGGRVTKTSARPKNLTKQGADWTSVVAGEGKDANLIRVESHFMSAAQRKGAVVKFVVFERLKTDLNDTHTLGHALVKVTDIVAHSEEKAKEMRLGIEKKGKPNGELRVAAWSPKPLEPVVPPFVLDFWRPIMVLSLLVSYGVARRLSRMLARGVVVLGAAWFALEVPMLLGAALTAILAVAVPGLNLSVSAVRFVFSFAKKDDRRILQLNLEVEDFALANDPDGKYFHQNFVSASFIDLRVGVDPAFLARRLLAAFQRRVKYDPPPCHKKMAAEDTHCVVSARASDLAAKDHSKLLGDSSDPYAFLLAATPEEAAKATSTHNANFDADTLVQVFKTEYVERNLNPSWNPLTLDLAILRSKFEGGRVAVVAVYDFDIATSDDLIGVAIIPNLLDIVDAQGETTATITKRGKPGGEVSLAFHKTHLDTPAPDVAIAWRPFPSVHDELRNTYRYYEPTRLATVSLELSVDDPCVSFDISAVNDEFNVNNYVRKLAQGKIRQCLGRREPAPNTLTIIVRKVEWHKGAVTDEAISRASAARKKTAVSAVRKLSRTLAPWRRSPRHTTAAKRAPRQVTVTAHLRRQTVHFGSSQVTDGVATGFHAAANINVVDPSAVVKITVKDNYGSLVGQWITTLKMLVLAPENVHGYDVVGTKKRGSFAMSGMMQLRDSDFLVAPEKEAYVDLELVWWYDKHGKTHDQIMHIPKKLTALEQLQQNSAETTLKLGNRRQLANMLRDFPVLFDVQSFELNRVRFHLKALFQGYTTDNSNRAIFLEKLDLRDKLKPRRGEAGCDLYTLVWYMVTATVRPVLSEVSLVDATNQIISGVFTGLFSSSHHKSPLAIDHALEEEDDEEDA
ncbi:hypothetical protein CTAYLR_001982 [Chrysophaeum taylorii]|uniref:C2 domain-containing protein n=1 Tax=Chrysophaeum taylorii TaxID=2483200 RepID=A0AAD7XJ42_9STRA|nr:hypothetical protein CTAYLR_001982 [Chrysophaeum taylorii]